MTKVIVIALLCFQWYGPGGGSLATHKAPPTKPKPTTTASYKYYQGRYELKLKGPTGTRTYRGYGAPHAKWMTNPYAKRTNKTFRTGNTRFGNSPSVLRGSRRPLRH